MPINNNLGINVPATVSFQDSYVQMYPENNMPREVTFIVTEGCNLCCSYCYQHNKTAARMSIDVARKAIDVLFAEDMRCSEYINPTVAPAIVLSFIGGEPLLEIELIEQIVDYFLTRAIELNHRWATQYMLNFSSNGTLYFDDKVQRFLARYDGRVSMGITIDGSKRLHDACRTFPDGSGSFDIAAAAFRDILAKYAQTGTKLTIAPENIIFLAEAVHAMVDEFGITDLHANCVYEAGWTYSHAAGLYSQLKDIADWMLATAKYTRFSFSMFDAEIGRPLPENENDNWCGGTGKMLAIGTDGVIYPCLRYAPYSLGNDIEPLVVGHIDHGIEATQAERDATAMLRAITRRSQSTDECFNCPIAKGCAWCSAYNYERTGTPDKRVTYICPMHKARALANVYYWNKLARQLGSHERFEMHVPRDWALQIIDEHEYDLLCELAKP